jgi:hypothetical protein
MEPFTEALEIVAEVMRQGAASHPDNDWLRRSPEYHIRNRLKAKPATCPECRGQLRYSKGEQLRISGCASSVLPRTS